MALAEELILPVVKDKRAEYDLSSLRAMPTDGMKMTAELARKAHAAFGDAVMQEYGSSEGFICSTRPGDPMEWQYETQGRPVCPADEFRIVDDQDRDVPPGEVGELLGRDPYTIRGYYKAPDYNRTAFTPDGFCRTGDMVRLHPSGNLGHRGPQEGHDQPRRGAHQRRGGREPPPRPPQGVQCGAGRDARPDVWRWVITSIAADRARARREAAYQIGFDLAIAGTPEECREKLARYREVIDFPTLYPPGVGPGRVLPQSRVRENLELIIRTFAR